MAIVHSTAVAHPNAAIAVVAAEAAVHPIPAPAAAAGPTRSDTNTAPTTAQEADQSPAIAVVLVHLPPARDRPAVAALTPRPGPPVRVDRRMDHPIINLLMVMAEGIHVIDRRKKNGTTP